MEEDILVAERLPNSNEFNFQLFEKGSEMANNYCVLSEEFKVFIFLKCFSVKSRDF
ncbi:unnamed protein product [Meloidogyne enterolobii]